MPKSIVFIAIKVNNIHGDKLMRSEHPFILRKLSRGNVREPIEINYNVETETADEKSLYSHNHILLTGSYMTEARTDPTNDELTDRR